MGRKTSFNTTPEVQLKADKLRLIGKEIIVHNNIILSKQSNEGKDGLTDLTLYIDTDNAVVDLESFPGIKKFIPQQSRLTVTGKGRPEVLSLGLAKTSNVNKFDEIVEIVMDVDTSLMKYFDYMFSYLRVQRIVFKKFDTSNMQTARCMFSGCTNLKELDISKFDTSKLRDATDMFKTCWALDTLDVSNFNTEKLEIMTSMFEGCWGIKELNTSSWHTPNLAYMQKAFSNMSELRTLDISRFDLRKVLDITELFQNCSKLTQIKFPPRDKIGLTEIRSLQGIFDGCKCIRALDLRGLVGTEVTGFLNTFRNCEQLEYIDISDFNPRNLVYFKEICYYSPSIRLLDISSLDIRHIRESISISDKAAGPLSIILRRCDIPSGILREYKLEKEIQKVERDIELFNKGGIEASGIIEAKKAAGIEKQTDNTIDVSIELRLLSKIFNGQIKVRPNGLTRAEPEYALQSELIHSIKTPGLRVYHR